jgi:hypothetical protein
MLSETEPANLHADVLKIGHHGKQKLLDARISREPLSFRPWSSSGLGCPERFCSPAEMITICGETATLPTDKEGAIQVLTDVEPYA